jgi:hypothetical protein
MRDEFVSAALEEFTPPADDVVLDWADVLGRAQIAASAPATVADWNGKGHVHDGFSVLGSSHRPVRSRRRLTVAMLIAACALLALPAYAVVDRIIAAVTGTAPAPLPLGGVQDLPVPPSPAIAATGCPGDVRIAFLGPAWTSGRPPTKQSMRTRLAQVGALERRLNGDAAVKSVVVISPAQSFAQLKKKYPHGVQGLRRNLVPYIVDVWLEQPAQARRFVDRYRATKIPGVDGRSITIRSDDNATC